jgi:hypothetical protein
MHNCLVRICLGKAFHRIDDKALADASDRRGG